MGLDRKIYGEYGGSYIPEVLMPAVIGVAEAFGKCRKDPAFAGELDRLRKDYAGRPTPLYYAARLTEHLGGARIYLKREDLCHTGSHKINNVLGQLLLARTMGYRRVIAETGAGQHGVATATAAALMDLECTVYMGADDAKRQSLNVFRMELLGAEVVKVDSGSRTLKDATSEAIRSWASCYGDTYYAIGSVVGPWPYPEMVAYFQSIIGKEAAEQIGKKEGRLPAAAVACVGGGSNAAGLFSGFYDEKVDLYGAEAGGEGIHTGRHGASLTRGEIGVFQGMKSMLLQDFSGNILPAHSISAGLDYPGVGPLHAYLQSTGRAQYEAVSDREALEAFYLLAGKEGIIPALESAHALALAGKIAGRYAKDTAVVVCLSGRGDKDALGLSERKEIYGSAGKDI